MSGQQELTEEANWRVRMFAPVGRWLTWLGIAWLVAACLPHPPLPIPAGVDGAWYYALNLIHKDGARFGPDIAFTMGPLGYLMTPDPEITPWWQPFLLRLVSWVGLAWGIGLLVRNWFPWAALSAAVVFASLFLLSYYYPDVWHASYVGVLLAAAVSPSAVNLAAAGTFAGISLLLKANEALTALALYIILVAAHGHRLRGRGLWLWGIPVAILLGGLWAFNGGVWTVFPYVSRWWEVIRGYTEAAAMDGPLWQLGLFLLLWGYLLAIPFLDGGMSCLRHPAFYCALVLGFVSFKHGFVRQDVHADVALVKLAASALFLLEVVRGEVLRKVLALLVLFGCGFTWVYIADARKANFQRGLASLTVGGLAERVQNLVSYNAAYQKVGAKAKQLRSGLILGEPYHSKIGTATVDAFPDQVDWIRANGWNYRARPVIDALTVFTPRLNELNRQHFREPGAPEFLLCFFEAIDGRHPLMQDTGTVEAILTRYELVHEGPRALLLRRRANPRTLRFREIGQTTVAWGEPAEVPDVAHPETLWATYDIRPSPWGRLKWFMFRPEPLLLQMHVREGDSRWNRLVREVVQTPAPISPLPRNLAETAAYLRNDALPLGAKPLRLVFWALGPAEYRPELRIHWYASRLH